MKNSTKIIFLAIFFLFALTACASKEKPVSGRRVPQVLLAQDCGLDKMKCCDAVPACSFGQQCCADPNNAGNNYCADDCSCGDKEEFCCANSQCNGNLICSDGLCQPCGGKNELCCSGSQECEPGGLVCFSGKCAVCGQVGGPCCPDKTPCLEEGAASCLEDCKSKTECVSGVCQKCGFDSHPACQEGKKCLAGNLLNGSRCERCGGENQPCCRETASAEPYCNSQKGLICDLGFCLKLEEKK